ncbi:MAG TPA: ATP-binding protein [Verrucomicrobiae bacterium]|jgi:signal transduction histidine kinase
MADFQQNYNEINRAFLEAERNIRIRNFRIACILATIFDLAGSSLDLLVYPEHYHEFLKLRLMSAALILFMWWLVKTPVGERFYRLLGLILPALATFALGVMIYRTGPGSPYYAGLNLVLLGAVIILRWTVLDTVLVACEVLGIYLAASLLHGPMGQEDVYGQIGPTSIFFNNVFFIAVTGVFVVIGNYFYNQLRFREFAFRFELDKNKRELEETNRKLVELDQLKGRFFANISHEMRTPLTLLLSPLETMMKRFEQSIDDNSRELLGTMHGNGMRLLKLINDLLDLIRMEAGRMDIKSDAIAVHDFIKGLSSAVRQVAENKQISFVTQIDPHLSGILTDRDKLEKIILNLVFNALKFTPEGGRVWLSTEKNGEDFVLVVGDTGIGIAEKSLPFIFDRFWQADSSSRRKYSGVGIGLALVKELTEMMQGKVEVKSAEGKGTTFTIRLPYRETQLPKKERSSDAAQPEHRQEEEWLAGLYRRAELFPTASVARNKPATKVVSDAKAVVLVADDEPDMRRYLKSELEADYNVIEAVDGVDALEKASQSQPDIILLDMMMPQMDGLDACCELRKREATLNIPIILLTARADEETKFDALAIGANDFLAKPFSSTELQARIKNLIESHDYQRKLSKQNVALTSAIEQIKETEMQLVQSEKLASLGRMSAGIIHEINNPLNYTLTGLFALRNKGKQLAPESRAEYNEILNDIEEGIKRVRNIVSDLRTFTHPGGGGAEMVEVDDSVDAALRFLSGEWKGKVHIERNVPADLMVWASRNKLIHVLVNLLQNSIDALGDKTFNEGERQTIWIEGQAGAERNRIIVRDNGPGIDPQVLDKIFDPFFTTKDVGKGMGLGLSICYRILQGYGGSISVKSERGKNCEFTIELPAKHRSVETETHDEQLVRL